MFMRMRYGFILITVILILLSTTVSAFEARIDSVNALGHSYIFSNVDESIDMYRDLAAEAKQLGYVHGEGQALQNVAISLSLNGRHDDSMEAFLQAVRLFEEHGMHKDLAEAYGEIGYQMKRRNMPGAIETMQRGIVIAERIEDKVLLCALYDNFGVLQEMSSRLDSASYYYRKALDLKMSLNDSLGIPFSLNNLSGIHSMQGEHAAAESLLTISDGYRQKPDDSYGRLVNRMHWGDLFFSRGDLEAAVESYRETLRMPSARELNFVMVHCFQQLAAVYDQQEDYQQAYRSHQQFTAYRDSLDNVETKARIAELEIEFQTEKKDRQIAENKLAIEERSRQVVLLVGAVIILFFAGVAVARYQHLKRKQLKREMELRGLLRRAEFQERMTGEKLRISRELHDNIGAQLTFLISSLDNLSHGMAEGETAQKLDDISTFGRTTLDELRQTVWAMKHEGEGLEALELKLNEMKRQCAGSGRQLVLDIKHDDDASPAMSSVKMLSLYRIAQEAVQNAVKHAGVERVSVRLEATAEQLLLSIVDDGPGFDESAVRHSGGLVNMKQRCVEAGGQFNLTTGSSGTEITCLFPAE
jgi:signal transduction histidine kinase